LFRPKVFRRSFSTVYADNFSFRKEVTFGKLLMNNALYRVFTISKTFVDRTKDGALYLLKEYFYNKYILQTTKNNYYNFKQTS